MSTIRTILATPFALAGMCLFVIAAVLGLIAGEIRGNGD